MRRDECNGRRDEKRSFSCSKSRDRRKHQSRQLTKQAKDLKGVERRTRKRENTRWSNSQVLQEDTVTKTGRARLVDFRIDGDGDDRSWARSKSDSEAKNARGACLEERRCRVTDDSCNGRGNSCSTFVNQVKDASVQQRLLAEKTASVRSAGLGERCHLQKKARQK